MKLELFDAYNIRARLSACIILLAPIAITAILCFEEFSTMVSSAVFVSALLAFTNYIPILQRQLYQNKTAELNYAVEFLMPNDCTIDTTSKKRYYNTLAQIDPSFSSFLEPSDSKEFRQCCESAVAYLRTQTRDNKLIEEENINHGLCRNLFRSKGLGIFLCVLLSIIVLVCAVVQYDSVEAIPLSHYFALFFNISMTLFWIFCVTKKILKQTAKNYAITLLSAIDML